MEPIPDRRSDDDLILATAAGDADAFAVFYSRHIGLVLAVLRNQTGSPELAADLAGESFAAALLACRRFRPGGPPATAWLLGIAENKLRESARRRRVDHRARQRLGMPILDLEDEDLVRIDELADDGERALALLDQLPAAQRQAVRARVLDDADYRALAAQMGCSEQVARQHVSRGLRRLRTQLTEDA
jgi:RNA polymerase sigma factor (sigma-70 family)